MGRVLDDRLQPQLARYQNAGDFFLRGAQPRLTLHNVFLATSR